MLLCSIASMAVPQLGSVATPQGQSHQPRPSHGHQPAHSSRKMSAQDEHLLQHIKNMASAPGGGT